MSKIACFIHGIALTLVILFLNTISISDEYYESLDKCKSYKESECNMKIKIIYTKKSEGVN